MIDYGLVAPELTLAVTSILVLVLSMFLRDDEEGRLKDAPTYLSLLGLTAALFFAVRMLGSEASLFGDSWLVDSFSIYFKILFLTAAFLVVLGSRDFMRDRPDFGEYHALLLWATLGMMWVSSSGDMIDLFVSFEFTAICNYALVSYFKDPRGSEAAIKYFIVGAMSASLVLFGMSMIYGATGTTNMHAIAAALSSIGLNPITKLGVAMLVAGFGFEMALVPFQMWVPDTYEGAPTIVTAFLAGAAEANAVAAVFRLFFTALYPVSTLWVTTFFLIAIVTMFYGNFVALVQKNLLRMLAYSSIGHEGYIAIALAVTNPYGLAGSMYHLLACTFTKGGAFIAVSCVVKKTGHMIEDFAGLRKRAPLTAFCLSIFLFSLAGIPPLGGFVSKFYILSGAISAGGSYRLLALFLIVNSAVSLYYYTMVITQMYIHEPKTEERIEEGLSTRIALLIGLVAIIAMGLFFDRPIGYLLGVGTKLVMR